MLLPNPPSQTFHQTRMHSSSMHTGRSLTVCQGLLWGGVCQRGGVPEGCVPEGGLILVWSQEGVSQHALRQTPSPVKRMTDRCKNTTLATTSLRPVKISFSPHSYVPPPHHKRISLCPFTENGSMDEYYFSISKWFKTVLQSFSCREDD